MFKLIKIINSRMNVPELISVPLQAGKAIKKYELYYLSGGSVNNVMENDTDTYFIPVENVEQTDGKTSVKGFIATPNMIFETKLYDGLEGVGVGSCLDLKVENDLNVGVVGSQGLAAILHDASEYEKNQTVSIRFNCK